MIPLARLLLAVLFFCCWERVHSDSTRPSSLAPPTHHYNSSNSSVNCRIIASSTCPALGSHRRRSSSRWSDHIAENQLRYSVDYEYDLDSITSIDTALRPDFWSDLAEIDARIPTNGEPPEQLVKVTDRRHRHPVFATICSLAFLLTIISIIVVCTH